ncbi:hypothetical protein GCM10009119_26070 [Algoriphagus jejuensis]|uniref:DUF481 domain-containing protein n=1 Tax=Algoriphagus jejuensis TaxID=419934 RepID=A0ABP3YGL2_9BACT
MKVFQLTFFGVLAFWLVFSPPNQLRAQGIKHFNGTIAATSNGISIIPAFTLGKPAVFFDLSVGGDRLSFDPMFRFGMNGKPWSFVFWWRYKVLKDSRFTLTAGAHPAFIFQDMEVIVDGKPQKMFIANRYLAGELSPLYKISEHISTGLYYLHGTGFNPTGPKNSDFLSWNTVLSDLRIIKDIKLKVNPQLYFLSVDENSGFYVNSSFTLSKVDFPIGFQTLFNQKIDSTVPGDDMVWNVSVLYSFANDYRKDKK